MTTNFVLAVFWVGSMGPMAGKCPILTPRADVLSAGGMLVLEV
jgi:hypothetical protein